MGGNVAENLSNQSVPEAAARVAAVVNRLVNRIGSNAESRERLAEIEIPEELRQNVFAITQELRAAGIVTEADYQGRSLKAQFKQADKVGAKLILVLGGDELAAGKVKVRDMQSHDEVLADLDNVVEAVRERL